jgi:poly-gamma-glutamate synthesis protein (capsule biosynthesis protein)
MGSSEREPLQIFLCGDVMTGRGIDQILPHPGNPKLYEDVIADARKYVALAEQVWGPIPTPAAFPYIWGDALEEIERRQLDARVINLETAVTNASRPFPKGINYKMSPLNAGCLTAAGIDCCVLSNNHVLDWGASGLCQTLDTLHDLGIKTAGAGRDLEEARRPAIIDAKANGRIAVIGVGFPSSGIPESWAASRNGAGLNLLSESSEKAVDEIRELLRTVRSPGTIGIVSIHWGRNWGYNISNQHIEFAHALIDTGEVDLVHGHSSHHIKAIEVYKSRLVLYGCGDFLTDYEGIGGYERFRPNVSLAYFATVNPFSGMMKKLELIPFRQRRFRLERASKRDTEWVRDLLRREGERFNSRFHMAKNGVLSVTPDRP